jgi:hypothetical protein
MGVGGNVKYQYKIRRNPPSGWWLVFEGTEEDGFEVIASFLRRDDAGAFVELIPEKIKEDNDEESDE